MTKRVVLASILGSVIVLSAAYLWFFKDLDWELISQMKSPDGRIIAKHLRSKDDGVGIAPYGDHLFLVPSGLSRFRGRGELVFGSYCQKGLNYAWESNIRLRISCDIDPRHHGIPKFFGSAQGVDINYEIREADTGKLISQSW